MPVYNGSRWLAEAIDSVLAQTLSNFELLVIDDGSTDDTPRLLAQYADRDRRIRVLRQDHLGLVAALNRGLAEARGPLLARLDADDRALAHRFAAQLRFLTDNADFGLVGSWARKIDEDGVVRGQIRPETVPERLSEQLLRGNPFLHSSIMMRTELIRGLGGYRSAFEAAEDYDLWLRVSEHSKVANLAEFLIEYRWHPDAVTRRKAIRQSFSVRLAQRSAQARRQSGRDPAGGLTNPPDWNAIEPSASFYADDAALYRLLSAADVNAPAAAVKDLDFSLLAERAATLTHAERRLALRAALYYVRLVGWTDARARRILLRLLRERPGIVARAVWSAARDSLLRQP